MHKTRKRKENKLKRTTKNNITNKEWQRPKQMNRIYIHNICTVYKWIIHMQWTGPMCHGICSRSHPFPNSRAPHSSTKPETQQPQAPPREQLFIQQAIKLTQICLKKLQLSQLRNLFSSFNCSVTVQTISPYKMRSQTDINSKFHQVLS